MCTKRVSLKENKGHIDEENDKDSVFRLDDSSYEICFCLSSV